MVDAELSCAVAAALGRLRAGDAATALTMLDDARPQVAEAAWFSAVGMAHLAAAEFAAALPVLRAAVALGETAPTTLLNLALAEQRAGDATRAAALMESLRRTLPQWDEPALRLAEAARGRGEMAAAERFYGQVLEINPGRDEALIGMAALLLARGEAVSAQLLLLRCCGAGRQRFDAWDLLGLALRETGDHAAAESAFAQAELLAEGVPPERLAIALRRMAAALAAGTGGLELDRLERGDALDAVGLTARAALLERLGRRDEAIDVLEVAVLVAPELEAAARARAQLLLRANRMAQALPALERAIALAPKDLDLRNNLAAALVRLQRHQQGREILQALIAEHGEHVGLLCNLTNALVSLGLHDEALETAERGVALEPDSCVAWRALCNALPYCPASDGAALLQAAGQAGGTLTRSAGWSGERSADPARRLRVGLMSPSLKTHPVGWLTIAGLEMLDPAAFDLVCLGPEHPGDALGRRFAALSSAWHAVDRQGGDDAAVQAIRGLGLDVLIDLGGYGDQGMMALCAHRLAPVQIKWVGSQSHSTGLAEMDWFVSDGWETPPGSEALYSERLLRLADGYVCYSPPAYAPDVGGLPATRNGYVTFGCFNNLAKVTAQVIEAWAGILGQVAGARLVLKCHQMAEAATRDRVLGAFATHGIDPARIELRANSSHRGLLAQYGDIDIVLDPFPYSGGLTTCEALWMGVPTVTLPGDSFASRHSTSHVSNVGLTDWVAADLDAYRAIAVAKAGDIAALAGLRAGLRARVAASPLCDAPRFGRSLAAGLRHAWVKWCATQ